MQKRPLKLDGCYELLPEISHDHRGSFVKIFNSHAFRGHGLEIDLQESYYTHSHHGVIRGLHFQIPPKDHVKIVFCIAGEVLDVLVDLRATSKTYGEHVSLNLNGEKSNGLYIPKGMAHGFCVLSQSATLIYCTTSIYDANYDSGILWNSAGVDWPIKNPIISSRDTSFPLLFDFTTPFV